MHTTTDLNTAGDSKVWIDYARICKTYDLKQVDMDGDTDNTYDTLCKYEKMGWIAKRKADGKTRAKQKKFGFAKGAAYEWAVRVGK